jgi:hypothetical protein
MDNFLELGAQCGPGGDSSRTTKYLMIIVLDGCVLMPERSNHKIIMKNFVGGGDFVTLSSFR